MEWTSPGKARPMKACSVIGCTLPRTFDTRGSQYVRRWCVRHAELYDEECAAQALIGGAEVVVVDFKGGDRGPVPE